MYRDVYPDRGGAPDGDFHHPTRRYQAFWTVHGGMSASCIAACCCSIWACARARCADCAAVHVAPRTRLLMAATASRMNLGMNRANLVSVEPAPHHHTSYGVERSYMHRHQHSSIGSHMQHDLYVICIACVAHTTTCALTSTRGSVVSVRYGI